MIIELTYNLCYCHALRYLKQKVECHDMNHVNLFTRYKNMTYFPRGLINGIPRSCDFGQPLPFLCARAKWPLAMLSETIQIDRRNVFMQNTNVR